MSIRRIRTTFFSSRVRSWSILLPISREPKIGPTSPLIVIYGFAGMIIIGTIMLMLPVSNHLGRSASPVDALFTATSAVCVAGLVVVDTGEYWSFFGQLVIFVLIAAGGFGFMASGTLLLFAMGRRIGLRERLLLSERMGLAQLGGLVRLVTRMAIFTIVVEAVGAIVFFFRFSNENSVVEAAWKSIFHSVSSFNNAGFDLFGGLLSMSEYQTDPLILVATIALCMLGGISFIVLLDIFTVRSFSKLSLDSKLVIAASTVLWILGVAVILIMEFSDSRTLGGLTVPYRILGSLFQSVTARTAGFSTVSMTSLQDYALFFIMLLMFIGGASGSTAGGIKVNNFGMLIATIWSTIRGKEHPGVFGREFAPQQIHRALAVVMLSTGLILLVVFLLTMAEDFRFIDLFFEAVSAFSTVGLSTGITPDLSLSGRLVIIATMFVGRLGPLTIMLALAQRQMRTTYRYPSELIRVG